MYTFICSMILWNKIFYVHFRHINKNLFNNNVFFFIRFNESNIPPKNEFIWMKFYFDESLFMHMFCQCRCFLYLYIYLYLCKSNVSIGRTCDRISELTLQTIAPPNTSHHCSISVLLLSFSLLSYTSPAERLYSNKNTATKQATALGAHARH